MERNHKITIVCMTMVLLAGLVLLPVLRTARDKQPPSLCKQNLRMLGLAMMLYRDNLGASEPYPAYTGSDFLLALYVSGTTADPDQFLCPSSGDTNADGGSIRFGNSLATSYRGPATPIDRTWIANRAASATPLACDDSEGAEPFNNHGDACWMLFADGHVKQVPTTAGHLLDRLAN